MSGNHYQVELEQQPIELYKLLKIADLVSGGGEAKMLISQGYVFVNDEEEYQKRKKIYHGDIVSFNGDIIELICHQPPQIVEKKPKSRVPKAENRPKNKQNARGQSKSKPKKQAPKQQAPKEQAVRGGRRSIKF